jgi:hypothetical protein
MDESRRADYLGITGSFDGWDLHIGFEGETVQSPNGDETIPASLS